MKKRLSRVITFLYEKVRAVWKFLQQNGFFDELMRGIAKFILLILFIYLFKQVVW